MFSFKRAKKDQKKIDDEYVRIIYISTPNFDEMIDFFGKLEIEIQSSEGDQLCPFFGKERGAILMEGNGAWVVIEENTELHTAPYFNLMLCDRKYNREKVDEIAKKINEHKYHDGLYGESCSFKSPDGGTVMVAINEKQ
jgi:hypothetical protein